MAAVGRPEERQGIELPHRLRLIESDVDRLEASLANGMRNLEERLEDSTEKVDARLAKILWALVGLLISVSTACLLIVVTGIVGGPS